MAPNTYPKKMNRSVASEVDMAGWDVRHKIRG
jgi:hypothetical protein